MDYEDYLRLGVDERRVVLFWLVVGIWRGEVEGIMIAYALAQCGVHWDPDAGRFVAQT